MSVHCGPDCRYGTDEAAIYSGKCVGFPALNKFIAKSDLLLHGFRSNLFKTFWFANATWNGLSVYPRNRQNRLQNSDSLLKSHHINYLAWISLSMDKLVSALHGVWINLLSIWVRYETGSQWLESFTYPSLQFLYLLYIWEKWNIEFKLPPRVFMTLEHPFEYKKNTLKSYPVQN